MTKEHQVCTGIVSVSQGCCNKVPNTRWLKIADMYYFTGPEARSPKSSFLQGMLSLTGLGEKLSLPPLVSVATIPWLTLGYLLPYVDKSAAGLGRQRFACVG